MTKTTENELSLMIAIVENEYSNSLYDVVWLHSLTINMDKQSLPGIIGSLVKKGLVFSDGDHISLSELGVSVYLQNIENKP